MSKYTSPPHFQMHHTVCLYVVDTATFQRSCATEVPLIISRFTTQQHARVRHPTRWLTRTRPPVRGLTLHTKTHTRRTTREASCRYVHPTRTILNAIDECATRRDASTDACARTRETRLERTDDGWPTLSRNLFFFSRRHRAASIGASRDRES